MKPISHAVCVGFCFLITWLSLGASALDDPINAARERRGLPALAYDADLNRVATERVKEYAAAAEVARLRGEPRHGMRFHRYADGSVAAWSKGVGKPGECLCWSEGSAATLAWAVWAWDQSPTHAPILYGNFRRVGLATVYGPDGALYVAAIFGQ